jgi:hypothetical protein
VKKWLVWSLMTMAYAAPGTAVNAGDTSEADRLRAGFDHPPEEARPRVWWHWMNGNVTQDGIRRDLQWMNRIGVGGAQAFDAALLTPALVEQRLIYMTPDWQQAFRYTAALADRLGLELSIASSPGWSESGGPWVKPDQGMKKLVWSETRIRGGVNFRGKLPDPPHVVGPFQGLPVNWSNPALGGAPATPVPPLYRDVAVIAYRLPRNDVTPEELHPTVTSSAGAIDSSLLWDGDLIRAVSLPMGDSNKPAWILLDYGSPVTFQSMSFALQDRAALDALVDHSVVIAELQCSADGVEYRSVARAYDTTDAQQTISFEATKARYFRLVLPAPVSPTLPPMLAALLGTPPTVHRIAEFVLHTVPRTDHFEEKAAFFVNRGIDEVSSSPIDARDLIHRQDVQDLTARLKEDGSIEWTPPAGQWALLRVGYSLIGTTNHPAAKEGTGLEVDKLDRATVKSYMDEYLGTYESFLGPELMGKHGLNAMVNDSWEAGAQNWTEHLPAEFVRRRGYDLRLWLPALTGRIIDSAESTDKFLWDFRRTLGELLTENHYGQIADSLRARGMIHYGESHESGREFIGDGMDVKRDDDIPMSAMWTDGFMRQAKFDADIRESASVAHIYGQKLVAAESMTTLGLPGEAFAYAPERLKPTADRELLDGLNRFVIHTSVHQPLANQAPGMTLGPFGQWFTRNETWANQAAPWVEYLARSSFLLQQGHPVIDVAYYYGQDSNITALYAEHLPSVPAGYEFDFVNAHALTRLSSQAGFLTTQSGMQYRVLALDPRARVMSLDVLKEIARLVSAGATAVGDKPLSTPSLADNPLEFAELATALWGTGVPGEHRYGEGRVISGGSVEGALASLKVTPDFSYAKSVADTSIAFIHRHLPDAEIYFVVNRQDRPESVDAQFRVSGRTPQLWHADTGRVEQTSYRMTDERTVISLHLDPHEAVFVVFEQPTHERNFQGASPQYRPLAAVQGPWRVQFEPGRGAPASQTLTVLRSWSLAALSGVRYFSGTAVYETSIRARKDWLAGDGHVLLDLGIVKNLAEVSVNGRSAGILWKAPFKVDITSLLQPGTNRLSVRITNLWVNRLIGDKQPGATPVASTTFNPYSADSPLLDSGLLGPVTITGERRRGTQH